MENPGYKRILKQKAAAPEKELSGIDIYLQKKAITDRKREKKKETILALF